MMMPPSRLGSGACTGREDLPSGSPECQWAKRPTFLQRYGTVVVLEIETIKRHLKPIRNGREG